jgi:hypothetical protein
MRALLLQLYAIRAQLECAITTLEEANGVVHAAAPAPTEGCPHPPEKQIDVSTFGEPPMIACTVCGARRIGTVP